MSSKKNLLSLLDEETTETNTIYSVLFKAQLDSKITHLLQRNRTLAQHNAMGMFYDDIGDKIDTFVETYMGIYEISDICVDECCVIDNPVNYFTKLYSTIEDLRKPIKETFLQNQIDEIQQLISHTLYRLKYITT